MIPRFTLGIEEEFQLIDPKTRELKSHIEEMLAAGAHMGDSIKPELHRSVIEVGSPVCADSTAAAGSGGPPNHRGEADQPCAGR